jgi:menaquinone-dependent protoporphyrinogen oxidase
MTTRTTRVLIGYGSRFGSTKAIAMRIADTVRATGADVDVRAVGDIRDCHAYDAVVLGSGVYDGSWTPEATDLVRRESGVLARKPVWLFSVGSFGDRHPVIGGLIKKEPKEIEEFERAVHPREYRVFAGVIDLDHWPAWGRLLFKAFGGRAGDNRDWPEIDSWAAHIGDQLQLESPSVFFPLD